MGDLTIRGRVIARTGNKLLVRTDSGDVEHVPAGVAEPGDLIEAMPGDPPAIVRAYMRGDYPTPETETARVSRSRMGVLQARARVIAAVRAFFAERGFLEVETPLLVPSPGLELHLEAVPAGDGQWLITSPEYQMKRLLAAGLSRIFTVCKCFRAHEQGRHHSSEFSMLEWYRNWDVLESIIADTEQLVSYVAEQVNGTATVRVDGRRIDVTPPWPRMTVADAMRRFAGVEIGGDEPTETLRFCMLAEGIDIGTATAWDDLFYCAFVSKVEPALAKMDRPLLLTEWPVRLAALARRKEGKPEVVERFEAYIGGLELANAFGELTDPAEQRARFVDEQLVREERGKPVYPIDEKLILALEEGLPPCAGIALGVDRLVMLVTGSSEIREVLCFAANEL